MLDMRLVRVRVRARAHTCFRQLQITELLSRAGPQADGRFWHHPGVKLGSAATPPNALAWTLTDLPRLAGALA